MEQKNEAEKCESKSCCCTKALAALVLLLLGGLIGFLVARCGMCNKAMKCPVAATASATPGMTETPAK